MYLESLNREQRKAVEYFEKPLLVLAGAGSGKTRVITNKIAYLIQNEVYPSSILALTFTNKAAEEMKNRVNKLVDNINVERLWIGTFHYVCLRILKKHFNKINLSRNFVIYDQDDQKKLIKNILNDFNVEHDRSDIYAILNGISKAKQNYKKFDEMYGIEGYGKHFTKIANEYEKRLFEADAVDFDNMINLTIKLFEENKDILEYYRDKFEYVLVDEYQDTNYVQFRLIYLLTGNKNNLCVVGDEDQSIYGWRGANIENIMNFESKFDDPKIIKLEQNYRSTKNILRAANYLISNNSERKEKKLWTDNQKGSKIKVFAKSSKEQEVNRICNEILDLKQRGNNYSNIAVFVRTNAQTRELERGLRNKTIPYIVIGSLKYFDRMEVKDILAYLKFYNNRNDYLSLGRIINTPKRKIGKRSQEKIMDILRNHDADLEDIYRNRLLSERINNNVADFCKIFEEAEEYFDKNKLVDGLLKLIDVIDYKSYLEKYFDNAEERWENVHELVNDIKEYQEKSDDPSLSNYLNNIALIQDIDLMDDVDKSDAVNILTIHKAKGLEFEHVFVSGLEDGKIPHQNSLNSPSEIEEERRLLYVAMTRAKRDLYLSWSKKSFSYYGYSNNNEVSRFLKEIPDDLLEYERYKFSLSGKNKGGSNFRRKRKKSSPQGIIGTYKVGKKINHSEYGVGKIIATKFKNIVVDFGDSNLVEINPRKEEVEIYD
ncbi:MAG: AAA family ATPase [Candidatus Mcinerneyibacterium aminivorans]|uniref:DNA 3'-5' helicase n=1 Tax=Candidatus Mcinerneyibacterium aminivorans TaxID=2703815 RepID=A0A5D0MGY4_9BACT|nr:MAG: AAA family ATPase [Candidatus Mcinerneyibacterium aminivorans]